MSSIQQKCYCGKSVTFDEDPYSNPVATKYWCSQHNDKPDEFLFTVQRKIPTFNKKGKMTIQTQLEYVTAVFCCPECGLEYYEQRNQRD